jgi:hypothetical protein
MSRRPCTFKQRDVTRAVKAIVAAGVQIERVEVSKDGKIVIVTAKPSESIVEDCPDYLNEWDAV